MMMQSLKPFFLNSHYVVGLEVHGVPLVVISGGRVVKDEEGLHLTQGAGRFVPTPPNAPYVYGRVAARDQVLLNLLSDLVVMYIFILFQ